jgi:hypothetical protein
MAWIDVLKVEAEPSIPPETEPLRPQMHASWLEMRVLEQGFG